MLYSNKYIQNIIVASIYKYHYQVTWPVPYNLQPHLKALPLPVLTFRTSTRRFKLIKQVIFLIY